MALWPTRLAHSDCKEKFEELMNAGIDGQTITPDSSKPGHFVVHGPKADEVLDALAKRAGIEISHSEYSYFGFDEDI